MKKVSLSWMKHSGTVPAARKKDTAKESSISTATHSAVATHSVSQSSSSLSRTSSSISGSWSEEGGAAGAPHRKVGGTDKGQWRSHLADMDRMDRMIERLKKSVSPPHPAPVRIPVPVLIPAAVPPVVLLRDEAPASESPHCHGDEDIGLGKVPGLEQAEEGEGGDGEGGGGGGGDDASSVGTGCNAVHPYHQSALELELELEQGDSAEALAAACDSSSSEDDEEEEEQQVPSASVSVSAAFISLPTLRSLLRQMRAEGAKPAAANLAEQEGQGAHDGPGATLGRDSDRADSIAPLPVGAADPVDTSSALAMLRSLLQQAKAARCLIHRSRDLLLTSSSSYPSPLSPAALSPKGR